MKRSANVLIKTLQQKKYTLALAESFTGGLAAHQLTLVKGTSDVLRGSIVCYHENVKCSLLKVSGKVLKKYTAESKQVTDALAKKLGKLINADLYAAITGLAAEGGSETKDKPVGTVFLAVYFKRKIHHKRKLFHGSPLTIQRKACKELYRFIIKLVEK